MEPNVVEVSDADFESAVLEASKERPVVVDMWAEWCGPCRILGPILEKVAAERDGAFLLAKLDVDANPQVASVFGVQSIPTVIAFRDGEPLTGFIGAYPEAAVNEFIDGLLPEGASDVSSAEEQDLEPEAVEAALRESISKDPSDQKASLELAEILLSRGDLEVAGRLVSPFLPASEASRLDAKISVAGWASEPGNGSLGAARKAAAEGRWRDALDGSLSAIGDDPDGARTAMLTMFLALGDDDPLVQDYRRKLTNALF